MRLAWSILTYGATVLSAFCIIIVAFAKWRFGHWRRQGVPHHKPTFPFGNCGDVFMGHKSFTTRFHELYKMFKGEPYFGAFLALQPVLLIADPELIKDVTVKFSSTHFVDHISQPDEERDPLLARNLFMLKGQRWRNMRAAVGPAFSSGKMKVFHPHVLTKAQLLSDIIFEKAENSGTTMDSKSLLGKFTTDAIATCAFGLDVDSIRNPDNDFYQMGLRPFEPTLRQQMNIAIVFLFPTLVKVLKSVLVAADVTSFFRHLLWGIMGEREASSAAGERPRGDYIDFLVGIRGRRRGGGGCSRGADDTAVHGQSHSDTKSIADISYEDFDDDDYVAQAFSFYLAGYETTSTVASFALFELAANPDVQDKLREEIDSVLSEEVDRRVNYDAILKMKYLQMVINEVLRKYPPFPTLDRVCTQDYRRADMGLTIAKGTIVMVPIHGLQMDPKYFPDPEVFNPERFSPEGKREWPSQAYLPFGDGPRICIGMRFAQMQIALVLVCLLSRLRVSLTAEHQGMRTCPPSTKGFLLSPQGGVPLLFQRRTATMDTLAFHLQLFSYTYRNLCMAAMAVAGWSVLQITVAIVTILVTSFILFAFWRLTYWRRKGIPYLSPKLPFGNANEMFFGKRPYGDVMEDIYRELSDKPYAGIYMALQPSLLVMDPKLINDILIRTALTNFQHHIATPHPTKDPYISNAIFFARGARWKTIRTGLSPAFSSGKMKMMYPLVVAKAKKLASVLEEIAQGSDPKIDAKFHAARYTTDVIASCGFGIETNALEDPGNKFFNMALKIFERTFRHTLNTMIILQFSSLVRIAGAVLIMKDVGDFFSHIVWRVVKEREDKKIQRGDFIDMLIQLKNNGKVYETRDDKKTAVAQEEDKKKIFQHFGGDSLVAHALAFITAGYETSSTALSFALLELARNPDCQEKLINEIDETLKKNNGEIDYDTLRSMVYLDKVVNETLRKYPALAVLDRYCTEEYRNPEYNLVIPKGMSVLVPVLGIHYDTKYYHDPYRFDPERFGEDTKDNRPSCTFMPFGEGPRICIGVRFAHMQVKAGLVNILSKMRFSVADKLKEMKRLPFDTNSFVISPEQGLLLTVHKRETSTVV
ncbi:uncharacterized protein LOC124153185 [Ischnura elegans]|uniref:uncharacterized protein LOC124153185 n=1 Tax=Ischnura elegans TaxID=197161 RepID=UPI001ED8746A|nr:uncharacterized protein LOC124153185 [Ischnura elegans]